MRFTERNNTTRWVLILASFLIVSLILWNTYTFFQIFKNEERVKMQNWALAQKKINSADPNADVDVELPFQIIQEATIPIIVTEKDSIINTSNIDPDILIDQNKLMLFLQKLRSQNEPIIMQISEGKKHYLYYGDSSLLTKLKYYPIALLLIIFLFGTVVYNFYKSNKMVTQNKLWAGMAKETAHQIGTPLTSLMGWVELLKSENIANSTTLEIEKDIDRLQTITDRFSKIGSEPKLENRDILDETLQSYDYLQSRFSKQIEFTFKSPQFPILVFINPVLHSWTIENLVKNAIDAMKGRGKLDLEIEEDGNFVKINITDTGSGIQKSQYKKIFEPGFTTKKRGWGLGLSLTKRIVEEYHKGAVKVLTSEVGKGTTIQVSYRKSK